MKNLFLNSFKKRSLSLLIALTMCLSLMPVNAFATDLDSEPEADPATVEEITPSADDNAENSTPPPPRVEG